MAPLPAARLQLAQIHLNLFKARRQEWVQVCPLGFLTLPAAETCCVGGASAGLLSCQPLLSRQPCAGCSLQLK